MAAQTMLTLQVRALCLLTALLLMGCSATYEINKALQQASGAIQEKRTLVLNEKALADIGEPDIVVNVPATLVTAARPAIVEALNKDQGLAKEGVHVLDFALELAPQELKGKVKFQKEIEGYQVVATVFCSGFVSTISDAVYFNLVGRQIRVQRIEGPRSFFGGSRLAGPISKVLNALIPVINIALDRQVNTDPKRALLQRVRPVYLWDKGKRDQLAKDKQIIVGPEDRTLVLLVTRGVVRIDEHRITVLAKVSASDKKPEEGKPVLQRPDDRDLVEMLAGEAAGRIERYQREADSLIAKTLGPDVSYGSLNSHSFMFVTRAGVARATNSVTAAGPVSVEGKFSYEGTNTTSLTVPIPDPKCSAKLAFCKWENPCRGDKCERSVPHSAINGVCKAACCSQVALAGCAIAKVRHGCEDGCRFISHHTIEPIAGVACDAFRAASVLNPGMCLMAGTVDAASCTTMKTLEASLCATVTAVKSFYDHNPFADVEFHLKTENLPIGGQVRTLTITDDLAALKVDAVARAQGDLQYGLKYTRRAPTDLLLPTGMSLGVCTLNWAGNYSVNARAQAEREFVFKMRTEQGAKSSLILAYEDEREWVAYFNFSPSPLERLLTKNPAMVLNCPMVVAGAAVFGAGERVLKKKDARKVWPLITGENYPYNVKAQTLRLVVPTIDLKDDNIPKPIVLVPALYKAGLLYSESR